MGLIAFKLGAVPVYSYGLLILAALVIFMLAAFVSVRLRHESFAVVADMLLWGLPLALILGRAGYVLHHFDYYADALPSILAFWQGGYSFYGALAGMLAAVLGVALVQGLPAWHWLDTLAPAGVLALVVVTFGVFVLQLNVGWALPQDVPNDHTLMEYVESVYRPAGYEDTLYFRVFYQPQLEDMGIIYNAKQRFKTWKENTRKAFNPFKENLLIKKFNKYEEKRKAKRAAGAKPTILFASGSRASLSGNEEFIYNRMKERGLLDNYNIEFNFKENINDRYGARGSVKFTKQLAMSDIIMIDDFLPFVYKFDYPEDVKFVQVWHACGAFKSLGFEREGKPGAPKTNTRVHKCYTHMPVSSVHSGRHHAEAFGLPEKVFLPIGIPRTDIFFDEEYKKNMVAKLHKQFPVLDQRKKVYLYAPTFRGNNAVDARFPMERIDWKKWGAFLKERNELLLIKMHPYVKKPVPIPEEYKDYMLDLSEYREVNDILFISDVMITDYSSVMYEFSLLRRPMYFYAFDQRMYENSRDFYEPYEDTVPSTSVIVKTFPALMHALENTDDYDYDALDRFVKKNFTYTDGKSTDRFIDEIILK